MQSKEENANSTETTADVRIEPGSLKLCASYLEPVCCATVQAIH